MLNSVHIQGRFIKAPDYNEQSGVAHFTLACQRSFKNKQTGDYDADFIRCTAFRKNAEFIAKHFSKGTRVIVSGRWQTGSYTDQEGNKVYTNELVVNGTEFDDTKNSPNVDEREYNNTEVSESDLPF